MFRDSVGVDRQFHHAAAVEVLGHDFEQGAGVDTLPAVLADGDGQPGFMDSPNKKRRRPCMQSDVGLNDCVPYWQRDSLVSDSGNGGAGGEPAHLSLAGSALPGEPERPGGLDLRRGWLNLEV